MLVYCSKNQFDPVYPILYIDSLRGMPTLNFPYKNLFALFAIKRDFSRELLLCISTNKSRPCCITAIKELNNRGLRDIELIIHPNIKGLQKELKEIVSNTDFQLSIHDVKNRLFDLVHDDQQLELAESLGSVFTFDRKNDNAEQGWERWKRFCQNWEKTNPDFGTLVSQDIYRLCFTYLKYDKKIWETLVKFERTEPLQNTSFGSQAIWRPGENHISYVQRLAEMFNTHGTKIVTNNQLLNYDLGVLLNMPPQKLKKLPPQEKKQFQKKSFPFGSGLKKHFNLT